MPEASPEALQEVCQCMGLAGAGGGLSLRNPGRFKARQHTTRAIPELGRLAATVRRCDAAIAAGCIRSFSCVVSWGPEVRISYSVHFLRKKP